MKSLQNFKKTSFQVTLQPSLAAGVSCLALIFLLVSCGTFRVPFKDSRNSHISSGPYKEMDEKDYADHLAALKKPFLDTPGIKIKRLGRDSKRYLQNLIDELITNNEIFFKELKSANVTILDADAPLHFSLPKGEIFVSDGLISKYVKHESMLAGILAYELVRSEKLLYPKLTVVPTGYIPLEKMINFGRLALDEKMEIHKWAYYITTRSGFDGEYYLSWLQTQNRNTADFILQVGDVNLINREEALFKAFLIKNSQENDLTARKNSSKMFYTFLNSVRDGST